MRQWQVVGPVKSMQLSKDIHIQTQDKVHLQVNFVPWADSSQIYLELIQFVNTPFTFSSLHDLTFVLPHKPNYLITQDYSLLLRYPLWFLALIPLPICALCIKRLCGIVAICLSRSTEKKKKSLFFRAILGSQKNWEEHIESFRIPSMDPLFTLLHSLCVPLEADLCGLY